MLEATLLTRVNQITNRGLSSIATELSEALIQISVRLLCLKETATGTTTASQNYIDKPADMASNEIFGLVINNIPLDPISWDNLLLGNRGYCVYGDKIYFSPTESAAYAYTLYYAKKHPAATATIYIDDIYTEAVAHLTASKVYRNYEMKNEADDELVLYEREINLNSGYNRTPPVCRPHKGV